MTPVFADTGYWIAILDPRDKLHAKAKEVSEKIKHGRIITTDFVLSEFLTAFSKYQSTRTIALRFARKILEDPNVDTLPSTREWFLAGLELYGQRPDKEWSHIDCVSFEVMRVKGMTEALAHDVHFEQAGFVALLR